MGGRVYKGKRKEMGRHRISLTSEGEKGLFAGTEGKMMKVFQ